MGVCVYFLRQRFQHCPQMRQIIVFTKLYSLFLSLTRSHRHNWPHKIKPSINILNNLPIFVCLYAFIHQKIVKRTATSTITCQRCSTRWAMEAEVMAEEKRGEKIMAWKTASGASCSAALRKAGRHGVAECGGPSAGYLGIANGRMVLRSPPGRLL